VFASIQALSSSEVDVFASRWNAQLTKFIFWRPQPQAMLVNAFVVNWKDLAGYVFPSFALIFYCLEKIRQEKAEIVFVFPAWTGQPWFPVLLGLACDVPVMFRQEPSLLLSALEETHPLLTSNGLHLAAWKLSGDNYVTRDFPLQWSTFSWPETERELSAHTTPRGEIGIIGVCKGVRIPYRQL
jgi:hypothetical protein